jgi:hypothetical protein
MEPADFQPGEFNPTRCWCSRLKFSVPSKFAVQCWMELWSIGHALSTEIILLSPRATQQTGVLSESCETFNSLWSWYIELRCFLWCNSRSSSCHCQLTVTFYAALAKVPYACQLALHRIYEWLTKFMNSFRIPVCVRCVRLRHLAPVAESHVEQHFVSIFFVPSKLTIEALWSINMYWKNRETGFRR